MYDALFLQDSTSLVATGFESFIYRRHDATSAELRPHEPEAFVLSSSPDSSYFAAWGSGKPVEIWNSQSFKRIAVPNISTSNPIALFFTSKDTIMYANDNELVSQEVNRGLLTKVAEFTQPISNFVDIAGTQRVIVELHDGVLWEVGLQRHPTVIEQQGRHEHLMQLSRDRSWIATGSDTGEVTIYDTRSWTAVLHTRGSGVIRHVAFSPSNNMIVIAAKSGEVLIGNISTSNSSPVWSNVSWHTMRAHPRAVIFSPNGDLMMITNSDGVIWIYSTISHRWLYFPSGVAGLTILRCSPDGKSAAIANSTGKLVILDLEIVRRIITIKEASQ